MSRPATSRLKCNPPLGRMPVLQFLPPAELLIDAAYQRSIEAKDSQTLIRKIAQHWNWDLCQPLVVSRRRGCAETGGDGESYFVIDGQHRLAAAKLRGDIAQLPCVVGEYAGAADEAASFVHLNQQRRPLTKIDLFKAALASEDPEAMDIMDALEAAGLSLAAHQNYVSWKPGQVAIIGGIQRAWRREGARVTGEALRVLAGSFEGEVLRYAGTVWPGIVAVCAQEMRGDQPLGDGAFASFTAKLSATGQAGFRKQVLSRCAIYPELGHVAAAIQIAGKLRWPDRGFADARSATDAGRAALNFVPDDAGMAWCDQCDMRVSRGQAEGCKSRWCSLRKSA